MDTAKHFAATRKLHPSPTILAFATYGEAGCTIQGKMDDIADLFCALNGRVQQPSMVMELL